jgi:hypothetical protein
LDVYPEGQANHGSLRPLWFIPSGLFVCSPQVRSDGAQAVRQDGIVFSYDLLFARIMKMDEASFSFAPCDFRSETGLSK